MVSVEQQANRLVAPRIAPSSFQGLPVASSAVFSGFCRRLCRSLLEAFSRYCSASGVVVTFTDTCSPPSRLDQLITRRVQARFSAGVKRYQTKRRHPHLFRNHNELECSEVLQLRDVPSNLGDLYAFDSSDAPDSQSVKFEQFFTVFVTD